jgi:glyceraldehyde 3-phosphate dehydrogenase
VDNVIDPLTVHRPSAAKPKSSGSAKRVQNTRAGEGREPDLVMGVNHLKYDPAEPSTGGEQVSFTTNGLAPAALVLHENIGSSTG